MKIFMIEAIIAINILLCIKVVFNKCQDPDEIEKCNSDGLKSNCICRRCLTCPQGFGQNIECGSKISHEQTLKCEACKLGKNYSDKNNSAMCQPCPKCHGHKMLQSCTIDSATKCSPDICDKDHLWNSIIESCEPKAAPIETHTTAGPTTKHVKRATPSTSIRKQHAIAIKPSVKILLNKTLYIRRTKNDNQSSHDNKANTSLIMTVKIVVIVILMILVATIAVVFYMKRQKIINFFRNKSNQSNNQSESELLKESDRSPNSSPELPRQTYPWPKDFLLNKIPHDLQEIIENRIASPQPPLNGWEQLARKLKISEDNIVKILNQPQANRGTCLFSVLKSEKNKLMLNEFVDKLKVITRNDIVDIVIEYYNPITITVASDRVGISDIELMQLSTQQS